MEYVLPILFVLLTVLICILLVVLLRSDDGKKDNCSVYGCGGIDLGDGSLGGEELHGFRDVLNQTRCAPNNLKAVVFLEEVISGNRFQAELGNQVTIGRLIRGKTNINDLAVSTSTYLSRQHCRLFEYNGLIYVENLSRGGTVVNGVEISQPMCVRAGDILLLGDVQIRILEINLYN